MKISDKTFVVFNKFSRQIEKYCKNVERTATGEAFLLLLLSPMGRVAFADEVSKRRERSCLPRIL